MNIVFVYPVFPTRGVALHYPLGLITVATIARNLGHTVKIVNLNLDKMTDLFESLSNADTICYSGMITNFKSIIGLYQNIKKEYPKLVHVVGGPITLVLKKELLSNGSFHFLSRGSGELTMPAILDLIAGKPIKNVTVENEHSTQVVSADADFAESYRNSPFPDISLLPYKLYTNDEYLFRILPNGYCANLETSRGCPYRCKFCDKSVWGNKWAGKSAEDIAKEMSYLYEKFNINKFHMVDDLFIYSRERVFELCKLLSPLSTKIAWYCNTRANLVDKKLFTALRDAGCRVASMGIESGSQKILKNVRKGFSPEMVAKAVADAGEVGLEVHGNFVIGLPGEDKESLAETYCFIKKLNLQSITFSIATPFPNTELYEWAKNEGRITREYNYNIADWYQHVNINLTEDLTNKDIVSFAQKLEVDFIFKKQFGKLFFLQPKFIVKSFKKAFLFIRNRQFKRLFVAIFGMIKGVVKKD